MIHSILPRLINQYVKWIPNKLAIPKAISFYQIKWYISESNQFIIDTGMASNKIHSFRGHKSIYFLPKNKEKRGIQYKYSKKRKHQYFKKNIQGINNLQIHTRKAALRSADDRI